MIQQFEACPYCWVQKYVNYRKFPEYKPFEDGKIRHEEVDKYHKGLPYSDIIAPYVEKYPQDYRKQSEVKIDRKLVYGEYETPFAVLGFIDGIREKELVDLKYAQSKPDPKNNLQGIIYSWEYWMDEGEFPTFTWNWWNKKNNKITNVSTQYSEKDIVWAINVIEDFIEAINMPLDVILKLSARPFMNVHFDDCPSRVN